MRPSGFRLDLWPGVGSGAPRGRLRGVGGEWEPFDGWTELGRAISKLTGSVPDLDQEGDQAVTRNVLISGASTGIGRATAERLAASGWVVYAGVRDIELHRPWATTAGITPVHLDVTDPLSVAAAVRTATQAHGGRLDALVNNAGIPGAGPVEFLAERDFAQVLDVNVLGQVRVTQAALPALRAARGRIVFMSSLSGRVAMPFLAPYAASKHAVEAIADSLRRETATLGVRVSLIEPGNIDTPIWDKGLSAMAVLPPESHEVYGPGLRFGATQGDRAARTAVPAVRVAAAVERSLTARRPKLRYVVGVDARALIPLARWAPRLLDLVLRLAIRSVARTSTAPSASQENGAASWT